MAAVTRTVLLFGDSNMRGFGVGREARFAALAESALAPTATAAWQFAVSSCASELGLIRQRLPHALTKYAPDLLVLHCPGGPTVPLIDYPAWVRAPQSLHKRLLARIEAFHQRAERRSPDTQRTEREVLYDGLYVDQIHRWKPSSVPVLSHIRRAIIKRFPTTPVITLEKYLARLQELVDLIRRIRPRPVPIVFLGLVPLRPDYYPGYNERVLGWSTAIAEALHRPAEHLFYVDTSPLFSVAPRLMLIRDGTHLSAEGHRRVAELIVPMLRQVMESCVSDG